MISVEEALERIWPLMEPLPTERRPLREAQGFVLAQSVTAPIDLPPFDNSAMDGYALRAGETETARAERPVKLPVAGEVAAGGWQDDPMAPGTAVKIMTGAPLPPGADAVLMLEDGRLRDDGVEIRAPVAPGKHVRRQGEDVRRGQALLEPGSRLNAQRLALLASVGIQEVLVHRRVRVSLLATGSELVLPGTVLKPGLIYDSNRLVLRLLAEESGARVEDGGIAVDDPDEIARAIQRAQGTDLLLISGGVSVGAHDHVKKVLQDLGAQTVFWKVAMKPGKPIFCGRFGPTWTFGLPGNPISCVVGFLVFIEPLIRRLEGEPLAKPRYAKARLTRSVQKKDDRRYFLTAWVSAGSDGFLEAAPTEKQGSAMMQALAQANAFVVVPEDRASIPAGETVEVLLFHG